MFRLSKKAFTDGTSLLISEAGHRMRGTSVPFDSHKRGAFVSATETEKEEYKIESVIPEVKRPAERASAATWDEQNNRIALTGEKSCFKLNNNENNLRDGMKLRIDEFWKKGQEKSRAEIVKARFQAEKRKYYAPTAKKRGMSVEAYFEKLDQKAREISKDKEICLRIDGDVLKKILTEQDTDKRRFMSQFETKTSKGGMSLDFYERRIVERDTLGNYDPYKTEDHQRIIYGYLAEPHQIRGQYDHEGKQYRLDGYGDVVIVLKKTAEIKRRTSFTVGDSLDHTGRIRGVPYENPNGDCFALGRPRWSEDISPLKIEEIDPLSIKDFDTIPAYVEAQIHGGVNLHHVAKVMLTGKATQSQELLNLLREQKMSVEICAE